MDYLATHTSLSPIRRGFAPGFVNYKKGCTRLAAASDKVYQLLAHPGRWFSLASSTTKTGRHDIAEIFLKVALNTKNQIKSFILFPFTVHFILIKPAFSDHLCSVTLFQGFIERSHVHKICLTVNKCYLKSFTTLIPENCMFYQWTFIKISLFVHKM